MPRKHKPRRGSLQFWPRVRAKRIYPKVKAWVDSSDVSLLGFGGYKAGMTHVMVKDNRPNSMTKGESVSWPVTVVECPCMKIFSVRFYKKTFYGLKVVFELFSGKVDKTLSRKVVLPKKYDYDAKLKEIEGKLEEFDNIRIVLYTQPGKTDLAKKKPEIFEVGVGGKNVKEKFEYVKGMIGKEIRVSDVIKEGIKVDVHGVTKGKGFQGAVKRFGITLRSHKSEKKRRGGVLGPESPGKILWGAQLPGQMGFHVRTEYNKDVLMIGSDAKKVNPKGGFLRYGIVKNDYLLIKGSLPGPSKRFVRLSLPIRGVKGFGNQISVEYISKESKQ